MRMRLLALGWLFTCGAVAAGEATYTVRMLTPETALKAAQAALSECRRRGYQIAVAVTDRAGVPQALLRDRFAGAHTPDSALAKAWTAASFRVDTLQLAQATQAGEPNSGIRHLPRVLAVGGGMPIVSGGAVVGAIGVSGAPGGQADEDCARAGIAAIAADLEF
ncbi:MAG: heme-binding protein [Burkholderiaceae bacterium]|nr:heme-binding protein [Burkholderiaceae bacterium]